MGSKLCIINEMRKLNNHETTDHTFVQKLSYQIQHVINQQSMT
jgi:hypothetical protein